MKFRKAGTQEARKRDEMPAAFSLFLLSCIPHLFIPGSLATASARSRETIRHWFDARGIRLRLAAKRCSRTAFM
jgi:hypothetical protein